MDTARVATAGYSPAATEGNEVPVTVDGSGRLRTATQIGDPNSATFSMARASRPNAAARLLSAAATTNTTGGGALATARALHNIRGRKATASSCFLKLYDKATAPNLAADVPFNTLELVANATFDLDFRGYELANGLAYAITGAAGDTDTTAIAAGDVLSLNINFAT